MNTANEFGLVALGFVLVMYYLILTRNWNPTPKERVFKPKLPKARVHKR